MRFGNTRIVVPPTLGERFSDYGAGKCCRSNFGLDIERRKQKGIKQAFPQNALARHHVLHALLFVREHQSCHPDIIG